MLLNINKISMLYYIKIVFLRPLLCTLLALIKMAGAMFWFFVWDYNRVSTFTAIFIKTNNVPHREHRQM